MSRASWKLNPWNVKRQFSDFTLVLSGPGAAEIITAEENSTSNCWPIMPKEDNLALVSSTSTPVRPYPPTDYLIFANIFQGDFQVSTIEKNFDVITPILTLFFPADGDLITKNEAQITCMKTIGLSDGENATMTSSEGGGKGSGGAVYRVGVGSLVLALTFAIFMT
jgi:hypothetical protein